MESTDEPWADPEFQKQCAEMQQKVDDLRGKTEESYRELLNKGPLPPDKGINPPMTPALPPGYFRDEHGQTHKMSYVLTNSSPDKGFKPPMTPEISFWRRLKTILKNKWDHHCPESCLVLLMLAVVILAAMPGVFEIMKIIGMGVYLLACAALVLWVIKVWTIDVIKQLLKK